jgi:glutamine synthetase
MDTVLQVQHSHEELAANLASQGVEYVFGAFVDVCGRAKSKCVPVSHLPELLAGHERYTPRGLGGLGQMTPDEDECVALPDPSTLCVLPWDRRFAYMASDLYFGGTEPFALCPRSVLKRQVELAEAGGFAMQLGVETELYFYRPGATPIAPPPGPHAPEGYLQPYAPTGQLRPTPAYDVEATLDMVDLLDPMVKAMNECGFGVFSFDAEGGDGQAEFDFEYAPALKMADRLVLFRLMAKQIAKKVGLEATFMPKPYTEAWGSGAHFNMSLTDPATGQNLFRDPTDPRSRGWSKVAYGFVAGVLRHAPALAAICTPTVNSFKRLRPRLSDGTVSWAPVWAAYGDNNRSCMLRLPRNRPCVENRGVDSAANPHLAAAFLLAAGLEGVTEELDPGEPIEDLTYDWAETGPKGGDLSAARLPRTLLEAIDAFQADPLTQKVFSGHFVDNYVEMKLAEWDDYHGRVSEWERATYLAMF